MNLSCDEQLVLGGILRFALRFDELSPEQRAEALARAGDALGLRAEQGRRVATARAGYRDAAVVMRSMTNALDAYLARSARELANDASLRAAIDRVLTAEVRLACVLAVETLGREVEAVRTPRHRRRRSRDTLFVDWLRAHWGLPPTPDDSPESDGGMPPTHAYDDD